MKNSLIALLFLSLYALLSAAESRVYLGCKDGIYLTTFDSTTGTIQPVKNVATATNSNFLALSAKGDFLYSVSEGKEGSVVAWTIASDGSLTKLNEQPTGGAGPCHVSISPSGRVLLAANYSGGSIAAYPIGKDGQIGERTAFFQFTGSGPNPKRQKEPHAHGIYCDPAEKHVYIPDLGTDKVWIYQLDAAKATLTPNEPAFVSLPPGHGPRHLAFGPDASRIYVNCELGLNITTVQLDPLKIQATIPAYPADLKLPDNADTAEIVVHPGGKFLYLSTRGYNSISSFTISPDGSLALLENFPLTIETPRHFAISPDGKWLIALGQRSKNLTVLAIDSATGKLQSTPQTVDANSPMCAVFVE